MIVIVNLSGSDSAPVVSRLTISSDNLLNGQHFLTLELGLDAQIILPGFGSEAAAFARTLAAALTSVADAMPPDPPAVAVPPSDDEVVL